MTTASKRRVHTLAAVFIGLWGAASAESQAIFATPDEAANALLAALALGDYPLFLSVAGPAMAGFWNSGDQERDAWNRDEFVNAARKNGIQAEPAPENQWIVRAGRTEQPFPAPLVKTAAGWRFDDTAGLRELIIRRIRRNEIAAVELCRRFREAEYEYRGMAGQEGQAFALKIRSTPGHRDGLFWSEAGDQDQSPVGPPFAAAAFGEQEPADGTRPLFGYYFKILYAQGPAAAGGALDYRVNGRLGRGFAMVAWPAEYGLGGTQSYLINHFGEMYRKDLGPQTAWVAENITTFNPDPSWSKFNGLD